MDMREPFINAVRETIEGAEEKICFDRFHVAAYFGNALDKSKPSVIRRDFQNNYREARFQDY
jgi:transposase